MDDENKRALYPPPKIAQIEPGWPSNQRVVAVLDGWRGSDGWEASENPNYVPFSSNLVTPSQRERLKQGTINYTNCIHTHPQEEWNTTCEKARLADEKAALATIPPAAVTPKAPPVSLISPVTPEASPATSPMFQKGLADRSKWESWYGSLSGDLQAGAYYWAGQRSLAHPGPCEGSSMFITGCQQAKERLTAADALRKSEPDYKLGWNAYGH